MRFNSDGKFKIMQITDIQEIPKVSPDTLKLINAALESEKPDLAVFTGDQIRATESRIRAGATSSRKTSPRR